MKKAQTKTAFEVMQDLADRYEAKIALEEVSKIIHLHPGWLEQEPRLKELIKPSKELERGDAH